MAHLKLFVFGPPRLEREERPVEVALRKALALVVYLAVTDQPQSRDSLATLFWPESDQREGRASLRRTLHRLGQALGDLLTTHTETVQVNPDAGLWVDGAAFRQHAVAGLAGDTEAALDPVRMEHLVQAAALYSDDFLAGFTLPDSPAFDEWQFFQREELRQIYGQVLETLAAEHQRREEWEQAIGYARRLLALDQLHEPAHRRLMLLYASSGQQAAAVRQYQTCARILDDELGAPPEEETTALYEAIRARRIGPPVREPPPAREAPAATERAVAAPGGAAGAPDGRAHEQKVQFCTTRDGVRIACATIGSGPPLVKAANWLSHLEFDWNSPVWRHWLQSLSQEHTLVRYDERGCGLSDWNVDTFSVDAWVQDLEAVVDALGLGRFPLLGISQGGPVAITYAVRHPERVSHLILYGTYARGRLRRNPTPQQREEAEMMLMMTRLGWGRESPAFRQVFTSLFIPDGSPEQMGWFNDLQRVSTSPENAVEFQRAFAEIDVRDLAAQVAAPTLVLHARDDARVPFEDGRQLASLIPGARFVQLEGRNHILLEGEPAWQKFLEEVRGFLRAETRAYPVPEVQSAQSRQTARLRHLEASAPVFNLPAPPAPLVGRERELAEITRMLRDDPDCRLLVVLGPGGIGKTRLALEVARQVSEAFAHGVAFVPLSAVEGADRMLSAIAAAVGYTFHGGAEPQGQLLGYLREKSLLLVLDNFEHQLEGAPLVAQILQAAPSVKVLVTSRERLNLSGEAVQTLGAMAFPERDEPADPAEYAALELLLQRAQLVRPAAELSERDLAAAARICRLVQGMPLALVLAAGWLDVLSFAEIADEIARSIDFLETENLDVPERHRSVRAAFEYSWRRLSPEDQRVFMRLAVFRGGFSRRAAQTVSGAGLRALRTLANTSFLSTGRDDGYEIHDILRQYAEEHLEASGEAGQTRDAHSSYYLEAVAGREPDLKGRRQIAALDEIESDVENVRAAWLCAVERENLDLLDRSLEGLYLFCDMRSRFEEGVELLERAAQRLAHTGGAASRLRGRVVARTGMLQSRVLSRRADVVARIEEALALARRAQDQREVAFCLLALGCARADVMHDYPAALETFEQSLAGFSELGDQFYTTRSLQRLGHCHSVVTGLANSMRLTLQSLKLAREHENKVDAALSLADAAIFALFSGDDAAAEGFAAEAIAAAGEIGDRVSLAQARTALGYVYFRQGDLSRAADLADAGLSTAAEIGFTRGRAFALPLVSLLESVGGRPPSGATRQVDDDPLPDNRLFTLLADWAAAVALCESDPAAARRRLRSALAFAGESALPHMTALLLAPSAVVLAGAGRDQQAVELLARAAAHPPSVTGWVERWALAGRLRSLMEISLGSDAFRAAWERGVQLDLDALARELQAELAEGEGRFREA